ncbi:sugar-transfer associated ATP-grasp domain-containing protein [Aestuariivirga sp.]|uniref:sugar-transfer associated ATP-grasp domain-containing protein n=1 Tax=Aestuariivirga sp. TaxID=2650926 RepID=UPI00391A0819
MEFHDRLKTSSAKGIVSDYQRQQKKKNAAEDLKTVLWKKHASFFTMWREIRMLSKGRGALNGQEYVRYQLYRRDMPQSAKEEFLTDRLHWPICDLLSSPYWRAVTEDKWICYTLLEAAGIPIPRTVAVFDPTLRSYGKTLTLRTSDDVREFLEQDHNYPLFVKPCDQLGSFGAFIITGAADGKALLHDGSAATPGELLADYFGTEPFLLQATLHNHRDLSDLTGRLATVRLVNLVRGNTIETPFAAFKIPAGDNIADNFWRAGNLLADVDPATGVIRRIVRGTGLEQEVVEKGRGLQLPYWEEVLAINTAVSRLFPKIAYNSLDIAITQDGPVVVEVNSGGSFDLMQVASGKGFLTPSVTAFFQEHGWPKRNKPSRR